MTARTREKWREASWRERLDAVVFVLKWSPLIVFALFVRFCLWSTGEVDAFWPYGTSANADNAEAGSDS